MKINSGIYLITNILTWDFYIGSAVNFTKRWQLHKYQLNKNIHKNKYLQNIWNKIGKDKFIFEVLEEIECKDLLLEREQYWINNLSPKYNILKYTGSCLGYKHSAAAKEKISIANKNKIVSDETRKKQSETLKKNYISGKIIHPWLGKHHSEETKQKLREKNIGKTASNETRKKMSENNARHFLGKKHSVESKRKISENHADISGEKNPMYGKKHTLDTKKKISLSHSGENHYAAKLNWLKVNEIREKFNTGSYTQISLAKEYNIDKTNISRIVNNKIWIKENI